MSHLWLNDDLPEWLQRALDDQGDPSQVSFATSGLIVLHLRVLRERARDASGESVLAARLGPSAERAIADLYDWVCVALDDVGGIRECREALASTVAREIDEPSFSAVPRLRRELAIALETGMTTPRILRELAEQLAHVLLAAGGRFFAERPDRMGFSMLPPWCGPVV